MGGYVVQVAALKRPEVVRRLIRLGELTLPVLVASGAHDVLIHAYASYAMSQRLPNAKVILYSDAGHALLFQHAGDFGHEVLNFLQ